MPYEISFQKRLHVPDPDIYINDCCWGGDIVVERFLPEVRSTYEDVQSDQEDWGWFIWFRRGAIRLALDVFCDIPEEGCFRVHLTAKRTRWLLFDSVVDCPELEEVKDLVLRNLEGWSDSPAEVIRLDDRYMPLGDDV